MSISLIENFSLFQIIIILVTYLFASSVKGVTGLGFSTVCLPFLALTVGLKAALPLLIIPSLLSNMIIMQQVDNFKTTLYRFWPMLLATSLGVIFGLTLLSAIDGKLAGAALGLILILWCMFSYITPDLKVPEPKERQFGVLSGLTTGFINGLTGSQVMPCVPYLMALKLDKNVFIQATNTSFTISSLVMAIGLIRLELFTVNVLKLSMVGLIFVFLGLKLGAKIRSQLSPGSFRIAALAILFITALGLLLKAAWN
jgi:hypothetical protein